MKSIVEENFLYACVPFLLAAGLATRVLEPVMPMPKSRIIQDSLIWTTVGLLVLAICNLHKKNQQIAQQNAAMIRHAQQPAAVLLRAPEDQMGSEKATESACGG